MKLLVNGIDIIDEAFLLEAVYEEFAIANANRLFLKFNDSDNLWQHWTIGKNDIVSVIEEQCDTKELFVHSVVFSRGFCNIIAKSIPCESNIAQSRRYENVKLSKIAKDAASELGFAVDYSNMTDHFYSAITIDNTKFITELKMLCQLEGIGIVFFNKTIILFDEYKIENAETTSLLSIDSDDEYSYSNLQNQQYNRCVLTNGDIVGNFEINNGAERTFAYSKHTPATTVGEANRFAKGLLRFANKGIKTGYVKTELKTEFAAGSVVNLDNSKMPLWNGKVFISKIRHDFVNNQSKLFFRYSNEDY